MKKVLLLLLLFCIAVAGYSQKVYFIYLQSENGTPFFVKTGGKVYSSTASGYVILPKLVDSTYKLTVGLPGNTSKEATFSVTINNSDKGLMVQNADNSLKLYDWQTATIYQPVADNTTQTISAESTTADSFTKLLSAAADDASLLTAPIAVKQEAARQEQKQAEVATAAVTSEVVAEKPKADSDVANNTIAVNTSPPPAVDTATTTTPAEIPTAAANTATNIPQEKNTTDEETVVNNNNATIADANTTSENNATASITNTVDATSKLPKDNQLPFRRSAIMRKSESSTTEGFGLTYIDNTPQGVDTIRLLIPNPKIQFYTGSAIDEHNVTAEKKSEKNNSNTLAPSSAITAPVTKVPKSSCRSVASENDFYKLRKNMASEVSDEGMINEAKKAFRKKCYTTRQIKNLSALFLTPATKYQFFDAAYMHVSDQEQFKNLQSEIKDEYYANRFKALIGNL